MIALLTLLACMPDDYDPDGLVPLGQRDTGMSADEGPPLVGTWRSEGSDLSELFAGEPFLYDSVQTTFEGDGSYQGNATDTSGTSYDVSGTWSVDEAADPARVVLLQGAPYEATAEGIWSVDGDVLTYEVVQTVPDYGFAPPSDGFGSSSGPGLADGANVQIYRRVMP